MGQGMGGKRVREGLGKGFRNRVRDRVGGERVREWVRKGLGSGWGKG